MTSGSEYHAGMGSPRAIIPRNFVPEMERVGASLGSWRKCRATRTGDRDDSEAHEGKAVLSGRARNERNAGTQSLGCNRSVQIRSPAHLPVSLT